MGAFLIKDPKCIFIHIPKTGGASIRHGIFGSNYQGPVFEEIPREWEDLFSFTFVRNPYDRMISAWKMFSTGMINSVWSFNNEPPLMGIDFVEFLKLATDESIEYSSRRTMESRLRHHTLPQTHPYHCFQHAKFVGRFESLAEDFEYISKIIGLTNYSLEHWNRTSRKPYQAYYDEKSFDLVSKHYKGDIERFGYTF